MTNSGLAPPFADPGYGDRPMLIGGRLVADGDHPWLEVVNPATEAVLGRVPQADARDVHAAVAAASAAFPGWAATEVRARAALLRTLAAALRERADTLTVMEVLDTGSTIGKMRSDVAKAADALEYFAGLGLELKGETVPATVANLHVGVREPYGVVGRMVAFNHPLYFTASRMAAPLMAGNTVVMKPPEQAPLTSTVLAELCAEIFPPGVVNIVTGPAVTGDALVRHPDVRRLALIGSVPTGMAVQRAAAEVGVKHVTLELGGKNPMVVFPDADLDRVAAAAVSGMNFGHQGQSCGSVSRLFLHESVHDRVLEEVVDRVAALVVGDPLDAGSDMGAVVSRPHLDHVMGHIRDAQAEGARLVTGGARPEGEQFARGFWVRPTVFADVAPSMRVFREEVFGPVLSVIRWRDPAELLAMANGVQYGLTAAVWTEDLRTAVRTARSLAAGYVWVNGVSAHYPGCDFGGTKNSGVGTEEGLAELLSYTQTKMIHLLVG